MRPITIMLAGSALFISGLSIGYMAGFAKADAQTQAVVQRVQSMPMRPMRQATFDGQRWVESDVPSMQASKRRGSTGIPVVDLAAAEAMGVSTKTAEPVKN